MTAILKDLRSLKAARDRGEITSAQYARAERVLLEMVEEAVVEGEAVEVPPRAPRTPSPRTPRRAPQAEPERAPQTAGGPARPWETVAMVVAGTACATLLLAVLIDSVTLALTLLVTMIAAASVWALRHFDE